MNARFNLIISKLSALERTYRVANKCKMPHIHAQRRLVREGDGLEWEGSIKGFNKGHLCISLCSRVWPYSNAWTWRKEDYPVVQAGRCGALYEDSPRKQQKMYPALATPSTLAEKQPNHVCSRELEEHMVILTNKLEKDKLKPRAAEKWWPQLAKKQQWTYFQCNLTNHLKFNWQKVSDEERAKLKTSF